MVGDEPYPAPDWHHWRARDLWRLDQAVALSLSIEPSRVDGEHVRMPGIDSRQFLEDMGLLPGIEHVPGMLMRVSPLPAEYHERLAITESCAGLSLPVRQDRPDGKFVEPVDFVAWARSKGFCLPPELGEPTLWASAVSPTPKRESESASDAGPEKSSRGNRKPGSRRRGPEPGSTGFGRADDALCPTIDEMLRSGKARSAIAAARILEKDKKIPGAGSSENRANRLARHYGKWKTSCR